MSEIPRGSEISTSQETLSSRKVQVSMRGLDVTIVPGGISNLSTISHARLSQRGTQHNENLSIGRHINEVPAAKTRVQAGIEREITFQFRNALDALIGKRELPISEDEFQKKYGYVFTPMVLGDNEQGIITDWIHRKGIEKEEGDRKYDMSALFKELRDANRGEQFRQDPLRIIQIVSSLQKLYSQFMRTEKLVGVQNINITQTPRGEYVGKIEGVTDIAYPLFNTAPEILGEHTPVFAGAMFVVTKDNKLVFNVRNLKNAGWKKTPGALAGMAKKELLIRVVKQLFSN